MRYRQVSREWSRDIWFPTMWYCDKCRLRRAWPASFKLKNSKWCSVSQLVAQQSEYLSDLQRRWSDCAYVQADIRLCWSHIPHCYKSHVAVHMNLPSATPSMHNMQTKHTTIVQNSFAIAILTPVTAVNWLFPNKLQYFSYRCWKHELWVLSRSVPSRRFYWVPTTYVFDRNKKSDIKSINLWFTFEGIAWMCEVNEI